MKRISTIHKITKISVDIFLVVGCFIIISVPYFIGQWQQFFGYSKENKYTLMAILIVSGLIALFLLWQVRKILKLVVEQNVFSEDTVKALRKISVGSALIALLYVGKLFFNFNIITFLIIIIFLIATLLFLTLKDVFKEAIFYKEENDWTV